MTFLTHAITGVAIGILIDSNSNSIYGSLFIISTSVIFSILPDINIFWKDLHNHHKDVTHYPSFWVFALILILALEIILSGQYIFSFMLFINVLMHLFLDTFGFRNGMLLLFPLSKKEYSITKIQKSQDISIKEYILLYKQNGNLLYEISFIFIAEMIIGVSV